jgi:SAM-dependent methyltransferase
VTPIDEQLAAQRWNEEYRGGKYAGEPALPFVKEIVAAVDAERSLHAGLGLYVGCGNGRNYLALVDAGLRLHGVDLSLEALRQLVERRPAARLPLVCGDFRSLRHAPAFSYLVAIQVFQHGLAADVASYFATTRRLLRPGGLLFLRVNSVSTEIFHRHTVVERTAGGITACYDAGPKAGLPVHFYACDELAALAAEGFDVVSPPREDRITRTPPQHGFWAQWETIWRLR